MSEDREPTENISGGPDGGGLTGEFEKREAETRAEAVIDRLGELYWQRTYGGQDAFECLVRTILSQNTSDKASQPAHDALMERYGDGSDGSENGDLAVALADAEQLELAETIQPAGLYNQKSATMMDIAERIVDEYGSAEAFDGFVREEDPETVRETLLDFSGVGPKTADCVLLFSGGRAGVFPVDTHVHRIYRRLGITPADADHEEVRTTLEEQVPVAKCGFGRKDVAYSYNEDKDSFDNGGTYEIDGEKVTFDHGGVPPEKCGFGHTASIQFGREYCTARKPACLEDPEACPMTDLCEQVGVYPETDEVVDPADAPAE